MEATESYVQLLPLAGSKLFQYWWCKLFFLQANKARKKKFFYEPKKKKLGRLGTRLMPLNYTFIKLV